MIVAGCSLVFYKSINLMKKYSAYSIILMLIVSMLVNGLSLSFKGEIFAHELEHIRQAFSPNPMTHLEAHQNNAARSGIDIDAATHLCLHSAGQYQPFFFHSFPLIPSLVVSETLTVFISAVIPETIPDLLLRPPRQFLS